jgi:hypothetical protein
MTCKEASCPNLGCYPGIFQEELKKPEAKLNLDSRRPSQDSNRAAQNASHKRLRYGLHTRYTDALTS